jgi:hypothetical protein
VRASSDEDILHPLVGGKGLALFDADRGEQPNDFRIASARHC